MAFLLHCGAREVRRNELDTVPLPPATKSFQPVRHGVFADAVEHQLNLAGYDVRAERHALNKNGNQYFGYYELLNRDDYGVVVGFRSSLNKSLALRLAMGSHVFLCDNLALRGEIEVFRKHTTYVLEELGDHIAAGVAKLPRLIEAQEQEFGAWKQFQLNRPQVDHAIGELYRGNVVSKSQLPALFDEFRTQTVDHGAPTVWRLFNATTQILKGTSDNNLVQLPQRTERLHKVLNRVAKNETALLEAA